MCIEENDNIPDNAASNADANFRYVTRTKKREQDWKTFRFSSNYTYLLKYSTTTNFFAFSGNHFHVEIR